MVDSSVVSTFRGPVALQMPDADAVGGEGGYAAPLRYYNAAGERVASLSADNHNHWGVYTKADEFGSGDTQPYKRFSIGGGARTVPVRFSKVNTFRLSTGTTPDDEMRLLLEAGARGDNYLRFTHGDTHRYGLISRGATDRLQLWDYQLGGSIFTIEGGHVTVDTGISVGGFRVHGDDGTLTIRNDAGDEIAKLDQQGNMTIAGDLDDT